MGIKEKLYTTDVKNVNTCLKEKTGSLMLGSRKHMIVIATIHLMIISVAKLLIREMKRRAEWKIGRKRMMKNYKQKKISQQRW